MTIRDRVRELRLVPARELRRHERNWRRHPARQRDALRAAVERIGFATAVLAYESGDDLKLIDGHLRADVADAEDVPVLVLDLTDEEADKLLAIHDPIGRLAGTDDDAFERLLAVSDPLVTSLVHVPAGLAGDETDAGGGGSTGSGRKRAHALKFADEVVPMTDDEHARLVAAMKAHGPGFFASLAGRVS